MHTREVWEQSRRITNTSCLICKLYIVKHFKANLESLCHVLEKVGHRSSYSITFQETCCMIFAGADHIRETVTYVLAAPHGLQGPFSCSRLVNKTLACPGVSSLGLDDLNRFATIASTSWRAAECILLHMQWVCSCNVTVPYNLSTFGNHQMRLLHFRGFTLKFSKPFHF